MMMMMKKQRHTKTTNYKKATYLYIYIKKHAIKSRIIDATASAASIEKAHFTYTKS